MGMSKMLCGYILSHWEWPRVEYAAGFSWAHISICVCLASWKQSETFSPADWDIVSGTVSQLSEKVCALR